MSRPGPRPVARDRPGARTGGGQPVSEAPRARLRAVPGYPDAVARRERLHAAHPGVAVKYDEHAPPYERWRGRVPGHEPVTSGELGQLLDLLEEIIAVSQAGQRWPGWAFTRIGSQWKAQEKAGTRAVFGPTLPAAEARVRGEELRAGGKAAAPPPTAC